MKVSEIMKQMKSMPVTVEGKIINVFERKENDSPYGKKYSQTAILEDDTGTIALSFKDVPDVKHLLNQTISICSTSTKHGLKGCIKNEYVSTKDGQTKHGVNVTGMAKITGATLNPNGIPDPVAVSTRKDAPSSPVPSTGGKSYDDKKIEGILTSYCKDVLVAMIQAGTEPDEAVSKAVSMIETLYSKVIDFCDNKKDQPKEKKPETSEEMANRLFEGDGREE